MGDALFTYVYTENMDLLTKIKLRMDRYFGSKLSHRTGAKLQPNCPLSSGDEGLTLVEMIVVLAIIAMVAALIIPNVIGRPDQARVTVAGSDIKTISAALKMYRLDNGDYPTTEQGLGALSKRPTSGPEPINWQEDGYLAQPPKDPWGRQYVYQSPGRTGAFELSSYGKDGKPGGEGLNADIVEGAR